MEKQLFKSEIGFKKGEKGEEDKIGINIETKVNDEFKRQTQGICNENKALPVIGIAFEAWDSWSTHKKIKKLKKLKKK
ncbi:hypothetical protein ID1001_07870 [Helicobacter pylori]